MFGIFSNIDFGWLYYALMAFYAFTVIGIIIVVLSENRSPVKSLAWVTVLLLMPLLGIILYVFFGRSIKNTRMISRRNRRKLRKVEEKTRSRKTDLSDLSAQSRQLINLTRKLGSFNNYTAESVQVFTDGRKKFDSLLSDIENARSYINLQYYIIDDDVIGTTLKDALIRKAKQGVTVRIIYDNVGSFKTKNRYFKEMKSVGIQVYPFFKVVFPPFGTRINWRNHRKLCIIDGRVGYIGGMNIADRYISGGKFAKWRDTHIRITGPAVAALYYSFVVDWNFMGQPLIEDSVVMSPTPYDVFANAHNDADSGAVLQILTSGPTSVWNNIAQLFLSAIASAQRRIYIQTPYFLPTEALLKALQSASLSGVDVRIMMPKVSDSKMLTLASSSYIDECLRAGIKIYFYTAGMLHAKTMLVDNEFVSIGSTNFDFRSFEHNFEANAQIYSRQLNERMARIFVEDMKESERVMQSEWKKRNPLRKITESATRLLSPIL